MPRPGSTGPLRSLALIGATLFATHGVGAAVTLPPRIVAENKIVYCTDISFPPLEYYDPQTMQPTGFDVDLGRALAKAMGVGAEFKNIAFSGLIPAVQAGQCNAVLSGLFDKPARREVLDFVDYAEIGNSAIVRSDSTLRANTLADLAGKKVAVESGSGLEQELRDENAALAKAGKPAIDVVSFPKASDAFQQLAAGLVDAYYGSTVQAAYYEKQNPGQVKLAGAQTSVFPVGIATAKGDTVLHQAIATALAALRTDGTYGRIAADWKLQAALPKS